jgi:hypothetical protein
MFRVLTFHRSFKTECLEGVDGGDRLRLGWSSSFNGGDIDIG